MITFNNENLIKLIFYNFTLYDLQIQFHVLRNKIINNVRLDILNYDKIFKSMGSSKLIFSEVNQLLLSPPVILPNGNLLSASRDKTIRFWDMKRGLCIKAITAKCRICTLTVLQNGIILAYLYGRSFQIWNDYGEGSTRIIENNDFNDFYQTLFLSNGDVACMSEQIGLNKLIILFLKDDYQSSRILDNHQGGFIDSFRNISNNLFYSLHSGALKIYDISKDYRCVYRLEERLRPQILINNMLFLTNKDIRILDINNEYKCLHCLKGHSDFVGKLLFIENNRLLLSRSLEWTIKVWDANNNYNCIRTMDIRGCRFVKSLYLKNGYFAAVFDENKIGIWDSVSLRCINTLEHDYKIDHFELLEDNRILSYSFHGNILIWSY
jgi:WD40 repeat protein